MHEALIRFIAYVPCATGPLSIVGSSLTLTSIARTKQTAASSPARARRGRNQLSTYNRLMVGISIFDLIFSFGVTLGPLPLPSGTSRPGFPSLGRGNTQSCTFQGFLIYLGMASFAYNSMLLFFYVLVIRYNVSDQTLAKYFEPFMHLVPIGYYGVSSILGLLWKQYNPIGTLCLVGNYPVGCSSNPDVECIRGGEHYTVFVTYISFVAYLAWTFLIVLWSSVVAATVMQKLLQSRRFVFDGAVGGGGGGGGEGAGRQERRHSGISSGGGSSRKMREVIIQCTLYATAFLNSTLWTTISHVFTLANKQLPLQPNLAFIALAMIFSPLQGLFNFLIYCRPRYLSIRLRHRDAGRWFALKECVWYPVSTTEARASRALNAGLAGGWAASASFATVARSVSQQFQVIGSSIAIGLREGIRRLSAGAEGVEEEKEQSLEEADVVEGGTDVNRISDDDLSNEEEAGRWYSPRGEATTETRGVSFSNSLDSNVPYAESPPVGASRDKGDFSVEDAANIESSAECHETRRHCRRQQGAVSVCESRSDDNRTVKNGDDDEHEREDER